MLEMLKDLTQHKGHANAALLKAIRQHETAAQDQELLKLLHHIWLTNYFWLTVSMGGEFKFDPAQAPESIDAIAARYRETYVQEQEWVSRMAETDLARRVETHFLPGSSYSIAEAMMQVAMHSHGHRAQCATRLRLLGGTPPGMDFILWLKEKRPTPEWK